MKNRLEIKLRLRIWVLPILLSLILILAVLFKYKGWWMIFLAFGLPLAFSAYSMKQIKQNLEIHREMRYGWATVGDVLEERIIIHNLSPIPIAWIEINDHTNIPAQEQKIGTAVDPHSRTIWHTRHVCTRRGLYHLGPTTVETGDLFGFFHLSIHDPTQVNILITPPVVPLPHIEVASGGRTGDGRLAKGILEQSVAVSTVRNYHPNDPLNHIHWPSSAKRGELTTRIFENTPTGNWWIIQDMNQQVKMGDDANNTLEIGIILSASLAVKGIQSGKAVGFIANDADKSWIPPQHTGAQSMKILRALALCKMGDFSLEDLLQKSRSSFQSAASLIIITSDMSPDWWRSLMWLKSKGLIPTVLLLDPASFGVNISVNPILKQLHNAGVAAYAIKSEQFADLIDIQAKPVWEWRVFATGHAVPVKQPKDLDWKRIQ